MNTEQYHKLMQKFFDGDTSPSEEKLLRDSEHQTSEDSLYFSVVNSEKEEKSKLTFSQFLEKAESDKIIPLYPKKTPFKWVWLAASLLLMFSLGLFWFHNASDQPENVKSNIATTEIYKQQKNEILADNNYEPEIEEATVDNPPKMASNDQVLDQILPKKSRMKKVVRTRYVDNTGPQKAPVIPEYESGYVIVNGHKITNEKDAIDVTKYSMQVLANNVNHSIEQADVVNSLNFDN